MKQNNLTVGIPFEIIGEGVEHRTRGSDHTYKEWFHPDGEKRAHLFDTENGWITDAYISDAMIPQIKTGALVLFDESETKDGNAAGFRRDVRTLVGHNSFSPDEQTYIKNVLSGLKKNGIKFFPEPKIVYDNSYLGYAFGKAANTLYVGMIYTLGAAEALCERFGSKNNLPPARKADRREP